MKGASPVLITQFKQNKPTKHLDFHSFEAMALVMRAVALLTVMTLMLELIHAAVYKVGDSAGWTASGNIDYKQWSATKTFQVGDVIRKLIPLPFLPSSIFTFYGCIWVVHSTLHFIILGVLIFHTNHNLVG